MNTAYRAKHPERCPVSRDERSSFSAIDLYERYREHLAEQRRRIANNRKAALSLRKFTWELN